MRIYSETTEQQGSDYVYAMVNGMREGQGPIRMIGDSVAITIAAWWQAPGAVGKAFAELVSTGSADYDALLKDIEASFHEIDNDADRYALMALFVWVVNKSKE